MTNPWDQHENESAHDYNRFLVYRDMGPARSVRGAAALAGSPRAAANPSRWHQLAREYSWEARAEAWDTENLFGLLEDMSKKDTAKQGYPCIIVSTLAFTLVHHADCKNEIEANSLSEDRKTLLGRGAHTLAEHARGWGIVSSHISSSIHTIEYTDD